MSSPSSYNDLKRLAGQVEGEEAAKSTAKPATKPVACVEAVDPYEALRVALAEERAAQMDHLTNMVTIICVSCVLLSITVALVVVRIAL